MLGPINSTAAFARRSLDDMTSLRGEAERLQRAISTGDRLVSGSDDPVAASRLRALARADRLGEIDIANASRVGEELALADDALASFADEVIRARDLALLAASDAIGANQRAIIADELAQIRTGLITIANARGTAGQPLFGGEGGGPAYVTAADGSAAYAGTPEPGQTQIGQDVTVARGVTGPEAFGFQHDGAQTDIFAFLAALAAALRASGADPAGAAKDALGGFDSALDSVTRSQTVIGVRAAWIDTLQVSQQNLSEARAREGADVGGADIAETIAQLQQTLTVLEASQAGFVRVSNLTLFDAI